MTRGPLFWLRTLGRALLGRFEDLDATKEQTRKPPQAAHLELYSTSGGLQKTGTASAGVTVRPTRVRVGPSGSGKRLHIVREDTKALSYHCGVKPKGAEYVFECLLLSSQVCTNCKTAWRKENRGEKVKRTAQTKKTTPINKKGRK